VGYVPPLTFPLKLKLVPGFTRFMVRAAPHLIPRPFPQSGNVRFEEFGRSFPPWNPPEQIGAPHVVGCRGSLPSFPITVSFYGWGFAGFSRRLVFFFLFLIFCQSPYGFPGPSSHCFRPSYTPPTFPVLVPGTTLTVSHLLL